MSLLKVQISVMMHFAGDWNNVMQKTVSQKLFIKLIFFFFWYSHLSLFLSVFYIWNLPGLFLYFQVKTNSGKEFYIKIRFSKYHHLTFYILIILLYLSPFSFSYCFPSHFFFVLFGVYQICKSEQVNSPGLDKYKIVFICLFHFFLRKKNHSF